MSPDNIPEGQLFTHVYCERGTPVKDSETFRRRIGSFCYDLTFDLNWYLGKWLINEIGLEVPQSGGHYFIKEFFLNIELKYMLNSITLVYRFLSYDQAHGNFIMASKWLSFAGRTLHEENMGYRLDDKCGVHYLIDEEFERNRISAVISLQDPKYSSVLATFEDAHKYLDSIPQDTKAAVRSLFESIEILTKQMVSTERLNRNSINKLKEIALSDYSKDQTAKKVVDNCFDGFAKWVDGMHNYRHGQDVPEPVQPPADLAVYIISSGTSFLRWLVEIDKRNFGSI